VSTPVEDEFTELVDADIPRVDLVDKAANGTRFLIAKQADGSAGLLAPDLVRDLIGKSEPEPTREETVTMSGSPGAIAKLIHEASLRREAAEQVAKAPMSTADQNDLPDSDFAYIEPGGKKDESGKTVPRSLRHFPINNEAHVRNALARAPQSPFGDKAMPKIRAAAKKFKIEVSKMVGGEMDEGMDGMDPTVILAAPDDDDVPGDPNDPGSPAWEAIDAATARKWTAILARARSALGVMSDREMLEAASADPDDAEAAMDLDDAACAIDYAISILAPFAVDEQAESDCGTAEMEAVGKALGPFNAESLDVIESLGYVAKAGRTLSAANEAAIRGAVESLQKVLASLPAAPTTDEESGRTVAKTANEEPSMPQQTLSEDVAEASGQEPAMGTAQPEPKPVAGVPVTETMAKADGEKAPMVAVYDSKGKLVGIVDPSEITPISGAESDGDGDETDDRSDDTDGNTPETTDLEPAPAAEVGTPADAAASDDDNVTKNESTDETDTTSDAVLKSSITELVKGILDDHSAAHDERFAKQADALVELAELVETLKGQVRALEEQPAEPKVFTNGAVPPKHMLRGQDNGAASSVDVATARELKKRLYSAPDAAEQNQAAIDMQGLAIAQLQEIHQRRP
jgi:hypothetical protein